MDAIIEGYDVLKELGYEILPKGEYENCVNKKNLCAFIYRFMFSNFIHLLMLKKIQICKIAVQFFVIIKGVLWKN